MRKLQKTFLSIVLIAFCIVNVKINVFAASNLYFDDPTVRVGEEISIRIFVSEPENVTDGKGTLQYDTSMLEFVSGTNASASGGSIVLEGTKNGEGKLEFYIVLRALKTGTTTIAPTDFTATNNGSAVDVVLGNSTVTIEQGANGETEVAPTSVSPTTETGTTIDIGGVKYSIAQDFEDIQIPEGFVASEVSFEGAQVRSVKQENGSVELLYLMSDTGDKNFFVYDTEDGSFCPFEQIYLTDDSYIILLDDDAKGLPSYYEKTQMTINGKDFPAWQNTKYPDFFAVSAVNSTGEKGAYSYDSVAGTYQRFINVPVEENASSSQLIKLLQNYEGILPFALAAVVLVVFLLFIFLIILGVKLRHRNLELDDLYDEYGIEDEEENEEQKPKSKAKRQKYEEDEISTYEDSDFEDDDFEEDADLFSFDDDFEDDEFSETEEMDFDIDDIDGSEELEDLRQDLELDGDEVQSQLRKKDQSSRKVFDTDFIDLD
ncbi:cohesin domain-containing protein [Ohessyouella blattaphilus]|uniref:Cohesin domain-containing protein n=1 Tax=Ohessyouella blattaphilus TaxID=2949333 RepID=A0ABT1EDB3_9FIRM|nr:cohesin domain-containing protein [Ohessyouella blattaphilus]MCP1108684.1 cohesin domain-containing protein [Ohessyouella blattaphilus]MCR8562078.1 cohesin domain-containing protein [Ohessyouella blattaphilus]